MKDKSFPRLSDDCVNTGPCRIHDVNNITFNPFSWNEHANIFYVDQPLGTGFSYADHGEYVVRRVVAKHRDGMLTVRRAQQRKARRTLPPSSPYSSSTSAVSRAVRSTWQENRTGYVPVSFGNFDLISDTDKTHRVGISPSSPPRFTTRMPSWLKQG